MGHTRMVTVHVPLRTTFALTKVRTIPCPDHVRDHAAGACHGPSLSEAGPRALHAAPGPHAAPGSHPAASPRGACCTRDSDSSAAADTGLDPAFGHVPQGHVSLERPWMAQRRGPGPVGPEAERAWSGARGGVTLSTVFGLDDSDLRKAG
jgi:hypothetical protein